MFFFISHFFPTSCFPLLNLDTRRNPAVLQAADKVFISICQALEAETIQGQTAAKVTNAAKFLAQMANLNAEALLATLPPETQQTVRAYFA
jgi:importin-5